MLIPLFIAIALDQWASQFISEHWIVALVLMGVGFFFAYLVGKLAIWAVKKLALVGLGTIVIVLAIYAVQHWL